MPALYFALVWRTEAENDLIRALAGKASGISSSAESGSGTIMD